MLVDADIESCAPRPPGPIDQASLPDKGEHESIDTSLGIHDAVLLDYADGGYRILMKAPGRRDARLSFGSPDEPPAVEAVSIEADATERAGP
jgi:hypothetical protein